MGKALLGVLLGLAATKGLEVIGKPHSGAPLASPKAVAPRAPGDAKRIAAAALEIVSFDGVYRYVNLTRGGGKRVFEYSRTPPHAEVDQIEVLFTVDQPSAWARSRTIGRGGQVPRDEVAAGRYVPGDYLKFGGRTAYAQRVRYVPPKTAGRRERQAYADRLRRGAP